MADRPLDDVTVIAEAARSVLGTVLEPDEKVLATLAGVNNKGAVVATDRRVAIYKNDVLKWWPLSELSGIVVHGGFTSHLALQGLKIPPKKLGLGDMGFAPHGLQLGDGKRAQRFAEVANHLIATGTARIPDLTRPRVAGPGLDGAVFVARSPGGYIALWDEFIRIKHMGLIGFTKGIYKGDKEIPIDQITAIQWREPHGIVSGHIQFTIMGGSSDSVKGTSDENSLMFESETREDFATLKRLVEERMAAYRSARYGQRPAATLDAAGDAVAQIRRLAELHAEGILTDEEFAAKKAELLARM